MPDPVLQGNAFWRINIDALQRRDSTLAGRLRTATVRMDEFIFARAADGSPVLGLKAPDGQRIALNDPANPEGDADRWIQERADQCLKGAHVMLVGFGAGYHALSMFQQSDENTYIWIVEPNPAVLKAAFHLRDFSDLIEAQRIRFVSGLPEEEIARLPFNGITSNRMRAQGIRLMYTPTAGQLYGAFLQRLAKAIAEAIQLEGLKFRTSQIQGKRILENVSSNLSYILQGAPCLRLDGKAAGIPALIIAPGPSLEEALPLIQAVKDRALLITVDTAHRILLREGIQSDLVVSLDFTELNAKHFEGIDEDDACLVAFPGIESIILKQYAERSFFFTHNADHLLPALRSLGPLGSLKSYGSTAHAAYHIARLMGCAPIVLIGNDLAFPSERWYTDGAMQNDLDQPEREEEELLEVPSNNGGTVKTNGLYKVYLDTFTVLIQETAGAVVNTSPHGAVISSCQWMTLENALAEFPQTTIDRSFLRKALRPTLAFQRENVRNDLHALRDTCRNVHTRLTKYIKRVEALNPSSKNFSTGLRDAITQFVAMLDRDNQACSLCTPLCPRSTVALFGQLDNESILGGDTPQKNQAALERFLELVNDFGSALRVNSKALEHAAEIL